MTHQPNEKEVETYTSSHEAIQNILLRVENNEMAEKALQHLRTEIYSIISDDTTPYKCRIYIKNLDFVFRIKEGGNELVINVMDHGAEYCWVNSNKKWFKSWRQPPVNSIKKLAIKFKDD